MSRYNEGMLDITASSVEMVRKPKEIFKEFNKGHTSTRFESFLACLFQRKSQALVITRSSSASLLSCKNFNLAHYSKCVKGINSKLGIFVHYAKMQLQDKGHNSEN